VREEISSHATIHDYFRESWETKTWNSCFFYDKIGSQVKTRGCSSVVERLLPKQDVAGSNPTTRSAFPHPSEGRVFFIQSQSQKWVELLDFLRIC
jgi:hypothetical protein